MNFAPFARLCAGEFGSRVQEPSHTLLVVNPTWTQSSDIGQVITNPSTLFTNSINSFKVVILPSAASLFLSLCPSASVHSLRASAAYLCIQGLQVGGAGPLTGSQGHQYVPSRPILLMCLPVPARLMTAAVGPQTQAAGGQFDR